MDPFQFSVKNMIIGSNNLDRFFKTNSILKKHSIPTINNAMLAVATVGAFFLFCNRAAFSALVFGGTLAAVSQRDLIISSIARSLFPKYSCTAEMFRGIINGEEHYRFNKDFIDSAAILMIRTGHLDINSRDLKGNQPIVSALAKRRLTVVKELLKKDNIKLNQALITSLPLAFSNDRAFINEILKKKMMSLTVRK